MPNSYKKTELVPKYIEGILTYARVRITQVPNGTDCIYEFHVTGADESMALRVRV